MILLIHFFETTSKAYIQQKDVARTCVCIHESGHAAVQHLEERVSDGI